MYYEADEPKPKLTDEQRKEWIEALRSGKYEQVSGFLKTTDGYCCIGVFAENVLKRKFICNDDPGTDPKEDARVFNIEDTFMVSKLTDNSINTLLQNHLIGMNDGGASFEEIADWLEDDYTKWIEIRS